MLVAWENGTVHPNLTALKVKRDSGDFLDFIMRVREDAEVSSRGLVQTLSFGDDKTDLNFFTAVNLPKNRRRTRQPHKTVQSPVHICTLPR